MNERILATRIRTAVASAVRWLKQTGVGLLLQRDPAHVVCPECDVDFAPILTEARCPICGWLAVAADQAPRRRGVQVRQATGLGVAWFVGVVVFALLAHALYG